MKTGNFLNQSVWKRFLCLALIASVSGVGGAAVALLTSTEAQAKMDSYAPGNVDANALDAAAQDCDSFCSKLMGFDVSKWDMDQVNGEGVRNSKNVRGGANIASSANSNEFKMKWAPADDQWCADHGSPTNESVATLASPRPMPSAGCSPAPAASGVPRDDSCDVPLVVQESPPYTAGKCPYPHYAGENCMAVKDKLTRCKLRNSQVESQCAAYMKAKQGLNWQWTMVVLDAAAAGVCMSECYASPESSFIPTIPGGSSTCGGAALIAGGTELVGVMKMQEDSTLKKILSGGAAGVGALSGINSIYQDNKKATGSGANGAVTDADNTAQKKKAKDSSCQTGVVMLAMGAVRGYNIYSTNDTMDQACKQVQDLASQSAVTGSGAPDTRFTNSTGTTLPGGTSATVGTTSASQQRGSTGSSGPMNTSPGSTAQNYQEAVRQGATDAQVLNKSGLGNLAMNRSSNIDPNKMMHAIRSGDTAGAMRGALADMGVRLPASGMNMANSVLNETSRDAKAGKYGRGMSGDNSVQGSAYAATGVGVSGGSAKAEPTVGFDAFGNNQGGGSMAPASQEVNMTPQSFGPDIWHANTKDNIFQIVSGKLNQVGYRVR